MLMGWEDKGLYVGTRDHSCPKGQVDSRVSLGINKGALVTGDRNPSKTSFGPDGVYVTKKEKGKRKMQELDLHQAWLNQGVSLGLCRPHFCLLLSSLCSPSPAQAGSP